MLSYDQPSHTHSSLYSALPTILCTLRCLCRHKQSSKLLQVIPMYSVHVYTILDKANKHNSFQNIYQPNITEQACRQWLTSRVIHLEGHAPHNKHLLARVRVVGWVIEPLGPPYLFLFQSLYHLTSSAYMSCVMCEVKSDTHGHA